MDPTATTDRRDAAVATVTEFFAALDAFDVPRAGTYLTPDVVWRNTTLPTLRGLPTVTRALRVAARPRCRFEAVVHHIASDGDAVLVERTDTLTVGPLRSTFWVYGTFEMRDGQIAVWRDYFSWRNVLLGAVTGTIRSLRGR